jgi:spermidine/putrescine-binding protein
MKKIRWAVLCVLFALLPLGVWAQRSNQLVIYTWEEMFPQSILDGFERANPGIKIVYKTFDYNEEMFDEIIRTDGGEYDLVIADDYILDFITSWELAQKLDKRKLSNFGNINSLFQRQFYDPTDEYTIPYGAGVQTIVYDPKKVRVDIKGYADLWNNALKNSVGITGNYRVIDGMALKVGGKSYNTENVTDIKAAGERLKALVPNIRVSRDFGLEKELLSGNISVGVMYTDQVMKSKMAKPDLKVVFPREGIGFGIMAAFIPVKAPNPDAAHKFLNYILDARRGAECFESLGYYCTYEASERYIKPELKNFLILPDFKNFEMIENLSQEAEDEHNRIWNEFISKISK